MLDFGEQALEIVDIHRVILYKCRMAEAGMQELEAPMFRLEFLPANPALSASFLHCCYAVTSDPIGFAADRALDVARRPQVEDDNRQPVVHAQRDRRRVHHLQPLLEHLQIRNPIEAVASGFTIGSAS